jgi:type I restriction enzyme, S subunit
VTITGNVGRVCVYPAHLAEANINQHIARVRVSAKDKADPRFLSFVLSAAAYRKNFERIVTGLAYPQLSLAQVRATVVPTPPLGEQRKIAAILSSVDDAIDATQAVIDQLQVVKKAMMAELLTRGLPGRHTKFKTTEIGEVPEAWGVELLDTVARRGSGHTPSKSHPEYWGGPIKWVSLQDSKRLDRLYIDETAATLTPLGIANSSATEHPAGTVVLSRDAGVGKSAITRDVMAVSQHFMAWISGPQLDNHYLYYWLQQMKPAFERIAIGNTIKTIGLPYFKALRLAVPTIDEQRVIARSLTSVDLRIFAEEVQRNELRSVKASLMSVLLTGEVRVTPDEDAA